IREYQNHPPETASIKHRAPSTRVPGKEGDFSESMVMRAYQLHVSVATSRTALAKLPQAANARADFDLAISQRQKFWTDTCREVSEMQFDSVHAHELRQRFGQRFLAPSTAQIQNILDALDAATPMWDKDHPELFYETLALNFPELVREG